VLQPGIDAGRYPGAQVYASVAGDVLADLGLGEARIGEAMTPETIVSWQCNTKPVVGVAIAQLCERGVVELDKPVATYMPAFAAHGKDKVTLRHLLTHTVRFVRPMGGGGAADLTIEEREAQWSDMELDPDFPLGARAKYTMMTGYEIAAAVLRHVDGRPLTRYVRDEIFGPLDMHDCWIGVDEDALADVGSRIAFLYDTQGAKPQIPLMMGGVAEGRDLDRAWAGTGGIGPMRELGRMYEALLASPERVAALTQRPELGDGVLGPWSPGFLAAPGFFGKWFPAAFGHEGLQFSMALADPDTGIVVSAMVNGLTRGGSLHDLMQVGRAVYDAVAATR